VQGALASGPDSEWVQKELSRYRAGAEAAVGRRFERAVAENDLPKTVDPVRLARYIITVIWGMSVQAAGGATRAHLKEIAEFALETWPA
jgi:hypothetical protein